MESPRSLLLCLITIGLGTLIEGKRKKIKHAQSSIIFIDFLFFKSCLKVILKRSIWKQCCVVPYRSYSICVQTVISNGCFFICISQSLKFEWLLRSSISNANTRVFIVFSLFIFFSYRFCAHDYHKMFRQADFDSKIIPIGIVWIIWKLFNFMASFSFLRYWSYTNF